MDTSPQNTTVKRSCKKSFCSKLLAVGLVTGVVVGAFHLGGHHHRHHHGHHHRHHHWDTYDFGGVSAPALTEECVTTFKTICPGGGPEKYGNSMAPQMDFFACAYQSAADLSEERIDDDCRKQMQGALSDMGLAMEKPAIVSILARVDAAVHCHDEFEEFCSDLIPDKHDFDVTSPAWTYRAAKCLLDHNDQLGDRCQRKISSFKDSINLGEEEFVRMADSYTWSWFSLTGRDGDFLYDAFRFALFCMAVYIIVFVLVARFFIRMVFSLCKRYHQRFVPVAPIAGYVRLGEGEADGTSGATWVRINQGQEKPSNQEAFLQV